MYNATSNHAQQQYATPSSAHVDYHASYTHMPAHTVDASKGTVDKSTVTPAAAAVAIDTSASEASASSYYSYPHGSNGYDQYQHGGQYAAYSYDYNASSATGNAAYSQAWQQSGYGQYGDHAGYAVNQNYNGSAYGGGSGGSGHYDYSNYQGNQHYNYYGSNNNNSTSSSSSSNYYHTHGYDYSASGYNTGMNYGSHNDNGAVAGSDAKGKTDTANGYGNNNYNTVSLQGTNVTSGGYADTRSYNNNNNKWSNGVNVAGGNKASVAATATSYSSTSTTFKSSKDEAPAYIAVKSSTPQSKVLIKNVFAEEENREVGVDSSKDNSAAKTTNANASESLLQMNGPPPGLTDYITRAFEACPVEQHNKLDKQLNAIINKAQVTNRLHKIDWENRALPSVCTTSPTKKDAKRKKKAYQAQFEQKEKHEEEDWKREKRARRFQSNTASINNVEQDIRKYTQAQSKDVIDWDEYTIVGTSQQLEKRYLRLTSAPDPTTVRPLPVLEKSLAFIRQKWQEKASYAYLCDQLKAVRQDLTVQRIKNEFTVSVYQIHARLALEHADLGEYNQCQTQLRQLYEYNIPGDKMEFLAYRILYMLHTKNSADIIAVLARISTEQRNDPAVRHALDVRSAIAMSDYHKLFRLYDKAPNYGRYLMDQFVERERLNALSIICRAYLPNIDILYVQKELGFQQLEDFTTFLCEHGLQSSLDIPNGRLDTRKALVDVAICMKKFEKIDIKGQV